MTRETRIALLVGLAFIVLFGLVLGQRTLSLTSAAAEHQHALGTSPPPQAPGPEMVTATISPPDDRPALEPAPARPASQAPPQPEAPRPVHLAAQQPPAPPAGPQRQEVEIPPVQADSARTSRTVQPAPRPDPAVQTYEVRPGDTLIRIARKLYGRAHEREYLRIYRANRSRMRSPSQLTVGQVLVIPPLRSPAPAPSGPRHLARAQTPERHYTEMTLDALGRRFGQTRVYVVRAGDCLSAIARRQMGDGSAAGVRRLLSANRNRIADPDRLPIGLRLIIPKGA